MLEINIASERQTGRQLTARKEHHLKLRIGRVLAGATSLAAATIVAVTGNASASEPPDGINWDHTFNGNGVRVYVEEHGDIVSVCDSAANGHSAEAYVINNGREEDHYHLVVTKGKGSCKTAQASDGGMRNLREGIKIYLWINGNGGNWDAFPTFVNDH